MFVGLFLAVLMALAVASQNKYSARVPGGLALSEFRGYGRPLPSGSSKGSPLAQNQSRQARKSGRRVLMATHPTTRVTRAVDKGETQGLCRLSRCRLQEVTWRQNSRTGGDEVIHCILDLMYARFLYHDAAGRTYSSDRLGADSRPHSVTSVCNTTTERGPAR